jgi:hypothetical protein
MDKLIVRAAHMIVFGATMPEVHEALIAECGTEDTFFLIYCAAKLHADRSAEDFRQIRLAMGG